jgi:hypothetical protein
MPDDENSSRAATMVVSIEVNGRLYRGVLSASAAVNNCSAATTTTTSTASSTTSTALLLLEDDSSSQCLLQQQQHFKEASSIAEVAQPASEDFDLSKKQ